MSETPRWRRLRPFWRRTISSEVDDEIRDHLESRIDELTTLGMDPRAARDQALGEFGDVEGVRSELNQLDSRHHTRVRRLVAMDTLWNDFRFAVRLLLRSPGFTAVAAISIALGIAGNTTIFSLTNAALLRPPGGVNADGLVRVYRNHHSPLDHHDLAYVRQRATALSDIVGERILDVGLRVGAESERALAALTTQRFFPALGVRVALGRAYVGDDAAAPGSSPVVVLSHRYWERRFQSDSTMIGRTLRINDQAFTVIGVADPQFTSSVLGWRPDFWIPFSEVQSLVGTPLEEFRGSLYLTARLAPGVSRAQAQAQLGDIAAQLSRDEPQGHERMTLRLDGIRGINAELQTPVAALSGMLSMVVLAVLLIACANVANLLLSRATVRRGEMSIRVAIGANRGRLVRQLLTESVLLALLGGVLGLALALVATRILGSLLPPEVQGAFVLAPDSRVLAYTAALCVVTGVIFGLMPALRATDPALARLLPGRADSGTIGRSRMRSVLVAAQVALSLTLLTVASLFVRSLARARSLDPGFTTSGIYDVAVDLGLIRHDSIVTRTFYRELLSRASTIPGVRSAALAELIPLGGSNQATGFDVASHLRASDEPRRSAYFNRVSENYFATLGIPLVRGREFLPSDGPGSPEVMIVNETTAKSWWPGENPVGQRVRARGDSAGQWWTVVGVARDARYNSLGEAPLQFVYFPSAQQPTDQLVLQVRTTGASANSSVVAALRELVPSINPALPPSIVATIRDDMRLSLLPAQAGAAILGAFGVVALLLAGSGIFGVTSYMVAQRTREIGIRMALGATTRDVLRLVLREEMRVVVIGVGVGLTLSLAAGRALRGLLYGVGAADAATLVGVPALLVLVAALAVWLPARRAAAVSPLVAMRGD